MSTYTTLVVLSALVIFSYLFDLFAKRTRFPSVLLLLATGIALRLLTAWLNIRMFDPMVMLAVLGNVGLILIVLEGALEIRFEAGRLGLIRRAFLSALVVMLATTVLIAGLLHLLGGMGWYGCLLNAVPFSIISSAIAIPSAAGLPLHDREFVVYESSFSDILGIVFFDFLLFNDAFTSRSFVGLGLDVLAILVIAVVCCLALVWLMGVIQHHIKFFLIISALILVYALAKEFHLSSLIIVLAFGLLLNNADRLRHRLFQRHIHYERLPADLEQMKMLTAESAFLIRTFFFLLFGFSMDVGELARAPVLALGFAIVAAIYLARIGPMALVAPREGDRTGFIAPRGLISILLFFSIPTLQMHPLMQDSVLFVVILCTSLIMSFSLLGARRFSLGPS
jgi:NhaP-type Na+/H+ or K+/H+ antiporter